MTKTILLADDSVTIRKVVELTFMDESFDLRSVGSGEEALAQLKSDVDLVIADVHMPGPDGYEVCEEVKKRNPGTPVLLLVGTFETFDESKAEEAGADDHLKKPFDSQDLLSRVHTLLGQAGDSTEAPVEPQGRGEVDRPAAVNAVTAVNADETAPAPVSDGMGTPPSAAAGVGAAVTDETAMPQLGDQSQKSPPQDSDIETVEPPQGHAAQADAADAVTTVATVVENLSDQSVDRIARRVVELLSEDALREVAWEVIPDLAEVVIKERLSELESQAE